MLPDLREREERRAEPRRSDDRLRSCRERDLGRLSLDRRLDRELDLRAFARRELFLGDLDLLLFREVDLDLRREAALVGDADLLLDFS